jgi:CheY-like chemotaxis protein
MPLGRLTADRFREPLRPCQKVDAMQLTCILLAEDNISNQKVTQDAERLLQGRCIGQGPEVLKPWSASLTTLCLDVRMPQMDGIEATGDTHVPDNSRIIAITAYALP